MYEFKDASGERVTVRSARTLGRLLADGRIVGETPFRLADEGDFVPAVSHPALRVVAAEIGVTLTPPRTASPSSRPAGSPSAASKDAVAPVAETERDDTLALPLPPPQRVEHRAGPMQPPMLLSATRPVLSVSSGTVPGVWNIPPRPAAAPSIWSAFPDIIPKFRKGPRSPPGAAMRETVSGFSWYVAALAAGAVCFVIARGLSAGPLAGVVALAAVLFAGRHGGRKIAGASRRPAERFVWIGAGFFLVTGLMIFGPVSVLVTAAATGGMVWGWQTRR